METEAVPAFGEILRGYRAAAGLTQEELAERSGLSVRGISDLERGVKAVPHRETVTLLADALGLVAQQRALFAAARTRAAPRPTASPAASSALTHRAAEGPPLVGRMHELALLERHLGGDGPPVLLLAGEPGMGKTRLLHEAAVQAERTGWTVLCCGSGWWNGPAVCPYASETYANQDALAFYTQALEICERLGDSALPVAGTATQKLAELHARGENYQPAAAGYERMRLIAHCLGDRRREGLALAYRGRAEVDLHAFEAAEQTLRAALALATEDGYADVHLAALVGLVAHHAITGRLVEAEAVLRAAEEVAPQVQHPDIPRPERWRLYLDNWAGRFDAAVAQAEHVRGVAASLSCSTRRTRGWCGATPNISATAMASCG